MGGYFRARLTADTKQRAGVKDLEEKKREASER